MTENHGYNTPSQGTQDWHIQINENFELLCDDTPIVDVAANLSNYTPEMDAYFVASDTGERYVGDGSQWVGLPTPGGQPTTTTDSALSIGPSDADFILRKNNGRAEVLDGPDGSVLTSGAVDQLFHDLEEQLLFQGSVLYIAPGVYETPGLNQIRAEFTGTNLTWRNDGVIRQVTDQKHGYVFQFEDQDDLTLAGGVWDDNRHNNPSTDKFGGAGFMRILGGSNIEIAHAWIPRGDRFAINTDKMTQSRIHHCYIADTAERGLYLKGGTGNEVDHNAFVGVKAGDIRVKNDCIDYHIHDNFHMMGRDHAYTYMITSSRGWLIERETVINQWEGNVVRANFKLNDGTKIRNMSIRDCYFHGDPDGPAVFDCVDCRSDEDEVDEESWTLENLTIENLPVNNPVLRDKLGL